MKPVVFRMAVLATVMLAATSAWADQPAPLIQFVAGEKAHAAEVNQNFATLTSSIVDNDARIGSNTTAVANQAGDIAANGTAISANSTAITTNTDGVTANAQAIGALRADVNANAGDIGTALQNITANTTDIAANTTNVATLGGRVDALSQVTGPAGQICQSSYSLRGFDAQGTAICGLDAAGLSLEVQHAFPAPWDLRYANMNGVVIGQYTTGYLLAGKDLSHSSWIKANIRGADFSNTTWRGATILFALIQNSDFSGADFRGAVIRGSVIGNSFLRGADFTGAILDGTDFSGSDLAGAICPDGVVVRYPARSCAGHLTPVP